VSRQILIPMPPVDLTAEQHTQIDPGFHTVYHGYGSVSFDGRTLNMRSAAPSSPDVTHATLVVADRVRPPDSNRVSFKARTVRQLRTGSPPNPWECAWFLPEFVDTDHAVAFLLKPNGWQLSLWDPTYPGGERFLATGEWAGVQPRLDVHRQVHFTRTGARLTVHVPDLGILFTDTIPPYGDGTVPDAVQSAVYLEDAHVEVVGWATA
jgi:hypothetical protein